MEKYKKLSDFEIEYIRNKFNSKQGKIEKLKRKLHLTNRQVNWLIDTKEREDLVDKLMQIENDEDEYAKSKIPFLLHYFYFGFKVMMSFGVLLIILSIITLFMPKDSPKYNDSAMMLLGLFLGSGILIYSLIKYSFLINLKKRYEKSNLIEVKKKILDLSFVKDGISIGNIYHEKVIAIKFLVEIENDKVYLIYPTAHFRKHLKGVRTTFNLENELKKKISKIEHKILYYDKARIIKKLDFDINNYIKDYLERR